MGRRPDLTPLGESGRELAGRYFPYAMKLARRYGLHWPCATQEFRSAASWALCLAARDYDPTRGARFATYARHRIVGALRDVLKDMALRGFRGTPKEGPKVVSLTPAEWDAVLGALVPDGVGLEPFEELLSALPRREAAILRMLYRDGLSRVEAGAVLGLSESRVGTLTRDALGWLRVELNRRREHA